MHRLIAKLSSIEAEKACQEITATLPEWFGVPEANERYAKGVKERISFGYFVDGFCIGMISLELCLSTTASIYWMGVCRDFLHKGIGKALLHYAESYLLKQQVYSLSVETLSPKANDSHYLKTFEFYTKEGFRPLFEMHTYGPEYLMIYLHKILSLNIFKWVDLTHELSANIPTWEGSCGFRHIDILKYEDSTAECKFSLQRLEVLADIGTHIDAPAHCFAEGKTINQLALESLITSCIVIDVSKEAHAEYTVGMQTIENFESTYGNRWKDAFVIFYTGWDQWWEQAEKYHNNYSFPTISEQVAKYLVSQDIMGIGLDTLSPDRPESGYPVHRLMLGANKYIVENIANARLMPVVGGHIFIMPLSISKGTEAPVRLIGGFRA